MKLKIHFLQHTGHVSSAQEPYAASNSELNSADTEQFCPCKKVHWTGCLSSSDCPLLGSPVHGHVISTPKNPYTGQAHFTEEETGVRATPVNGRVRNCPWISLAPKTFRAGCFSFLSRFPFIHISPTTILSCFT